MRPAWTFLAKQRPRIDHEPINDSLIAGLRGGTGTVSMLFGHETILDYHNGGLTNLTNQISRNRSATSRLFFHE
jgi:hypothetical protein